MDSSLKMDSYTCDYCIHIMFSVIDTAIASRLISVVKTIHAVEESITNHRIQVRESNANIFTNRNFWPNHTAFLP